MTRTGRPPLGDKKRVRLNVLLDPELMLGLNTYARLTEQTLTAVVENAIRPGITSYLAKEKKRIFRKAASHE